MLASDQTFKRESFVTAYATFAILQQLKHTVL